MSQKEWETAAKQIAAHHGAIGESTGQDIAIEVARKCFSLANKPVRELTQMEKRDLWASTRNLGGGVEVIDHIIAAHQRKQQEPETVTFRAARYKDGHQVHMMLADETLEPIFEWLPGEPQTIEVKLP